MSEYVGKDGVVKIGATIVGETKGWTLSESVEVKDATAQGDATRKKIAGFQSFSGSIEAWYDPDDAPQSGIGIGDTITFLFYPNGDATGKPEITGAALITQIDYAVNLEDVSSISFTFESTGGALTKGTVA